MHISFSLYGGRERGYPESVSKDSRLLMNEVISMCYADLIGVLNSCFTSKDFL